MSLTRQSAIFSTSLLVSIVCAAASGGASHALTMRDVPKIYGSYAVGGDCTKVPQVIVAGSGVIIATAAGMSVFPKAEPTFGYGGPRDDTITVFAQGAGEGLVMSFGTAGMVALGGDRLGPAERIVQSISAGSMTLRRCGAAANAATPHAGSPPTQTAAPAIAAPVPAGRPSAGASGNLDALVKSNVMKDAGFRTAYLQALGPLQREGWLIEMDGPGDQKIATVGGARYLEVTTCKEHDCGDNAMLVLYSPSPAMLFGLVSRARRIVTIGNPPPALMPDLKRLWKVAWPAG
jgi:hypothetical protein